MIVKLNDSLIQVTNIYYSANHIDKTVVLNNVSVTIKIASISSVSDVSDVYAYGDIKFSPKLWTFQICYGTHDVSVYYTNANQCRKDKQMLIDLIS